MKIVKIIQPLRDNFSLPFLHPIFVTAQQMGYSCLRGFTMPQNRYLDRFIARFLRVFVLPKWLQKEEVHLVFVCGWRAHPMCFPSAYQHEIIPLIWDCWPQYRSKISQLIKYCNIQTIIFTQQQNREYFQQEHPQLKCLFLPEAIVFKDYIEGPPLIQRDIDVLEYGRSNAQIQGILASIASQYNYQYPQLGKKLFKTFPELAQAISQSKIVICYPRCITNPEMAGDIETLTQRYWECMYSGTLMIGKAPKELIDLLGYNPVIESPIENLHTRVTEVLTNIKKYQSIADRNKKNARLFGGWEHRFHQLDELLKKEDYCLEKGNISNIAQTTTH